MPRTRTAGRKTGTRARRLRRVLGRGAILLLALAGTAVGVVSCVTRPPRLASIDGVARAERIEGAWSGLDAPVRITWDAHLIPSITAETDGDAAYAIGLVHAHLRMAQMDLLRKVSQGRLSEMVGPLAVEIDAAIRAIDLDRAVEEMETALPDETRVWLDHYVRGVNAYRARHPARPSDARTLGFDPEDDWTIRDVLTFGRLLSVDVNWGRWLTLGSLRDERGADEFVQRLWRYGDQGVPSFGAGEPHDLRALTDIGRSGSNAFVVSGARTASGGALIASDPHLGLPQPNIWCVVSYRTPAGAAAGLTIPGLPFVLVGRNEQVGWSGTNMQSTSTVLYRLPSGWRVQSERTEKIAVRFWFDRERTIRESEHGPVISDASVLSVLGDGDVAMRWRGHTASDESSAFLRAARAIDWEEWRTAFHSYRVGGQNMVYGDADGNIGQIMAVEAIPAAAAAGRIGAVDPAVPDFEWGAGVPSDALPSAYNPAQGVLVSANNIPTFTEPVLVPQGNSNDRVVRMLDLLGAQETLTLDDLAAIQQDTYSGASHRLAQALAERVDGAELESGGVSLRDMLAAWDGRYDIDSRGAVVFQTVLSELLSLLYSERYGERIIRTMRSAPYVFTFVDEDIRAHADAGAVIARACNRARLVIDDAHTWGDLHRLRLSHPIGMVPLLGRGYVFDDVAYPGSTSTIAKAAHPVSGAPQRTFFGANARLLCDMGTLDDNRVVLLGGQDGWMGSDRLLDQAALWLAGDTVPLPLSPEAQAARAVRTSVLMPARGGAARPGR